MKEYPLVSVYTCVYNGERTIHRVFESMKKVNYPNIEHVIVNDGSTDKTDALVLEYISQAPFPVKYHKKENGGKHTAMNIAWDLAEGEFLIQLDADDELLPHSIKYLVDTYYQIPESIRHEYWCVHGRSIMQHGEFDGDRYPEEINDKQWREAGKEASKFGGNKLGLQVRRYLEKYRFPQVKGLSHLPESLIWNQINKEYGTWYTNEVVHIYYVGEGGNLTAPKTQRKHYSPTCYRFKWQLMHPELYPRSFKDLACYSLLYFISNKKYQDHNGYFEGLSKYRTRLILLAPVTFCGALAFRILRKIK